MARIPFTALFLVLVFTLSNFNLARCKTLKRDVKALNEIKSSLGWRVVYAWVGDDPCGDGDLPPWSGVTCSTVGDYRVVTELEVYAVSIVGPFPTAVTNLLDLTRLDLHNNKLTGPIPPQIERLKRLKILNLRWNKLQDAIPPEIGELKSLTHLYLSFNNFKGEIPKELASLPELRYLYLHQNRFSGRIPPELGTLTNLRHLDVGNNHLVGTIRELIRIEGCFPALRNLYLNNNYITGGIPANLANLSSLEILYLSYNKMSGVVPSSLAHIPKLTYLYLDHNQFSGRIPVAFYKHPFLKEMYIEGNAFRPDVSPIDPENRADLGGIRDQKIPTRKTESIKDKKKAQNWFQRQFLRKMSHDYDSLEMERATAIAAAAFAISSQYFSDQKIDEGPESSLTKTKSKVGGLSKRISGSFKSSDGLFSKVPIFPVTDEKKPEKTLTPVPSTRKTSSDHLSRDDTKPEAPAPRKTVSFGDKNLKKTDGTKPGIPEPKIAPPFQSTSSRLIPPPPPPPPPRRLNTNDKKAAAWEREELEKIKQRYEKLKETIDSWENKKKAKARRKLEKKERSDSVRKREKAYAKFQSDMEYINGIARGASAQAEERRRNEELKVREKANVVATTGKLPGTCPCF